MTLPTHIVLGAIIGKVTGNYALAIGASIAPDLDHFYSYFKSGVIKNPKKFWNTIVDTKDPYGDQRGILHNFIFFVLASCVLIVARPTIWRVVVLGWLGHIALDALDNSDYWPIYPNKKINIRGPIKYASIQELYFFIFLSVGYLLI